MLLRHLHALRIGVQAPGDDEGGDVVPQQLLKAQQPLLRRQAGQIGGLHPADHLQALGVEVIKKAGELEPWAVDVLGPDGPVLIALSPAQHLQIKVPDEFAQLDAVQALHTHPSRNLVAYSIPLWGLSWQQL